VDSAVVSALEVSFDDQGFPVWRAVVAESMYPEAREAVLRLISSGRECPVTLRPHPTMPENMAILFGSEGSFSVIRLEKHNEIRD
jgi:hypothetical protein